MIDYLWPFITIAIIWSLLCLALNVQFGYGRLLNFGLVAWFASGAYTMAWITNPPPTELSFHSFSLGLSPWLGLIGAAVVGLLMGVVLSSLVFRVSGHQLGLGTYGFSIILLGVFKEEQWLTGGGFGIYDLPVPFSGFSVRTQSVLIMIVSIAILIVSLWVLRRIMDSSFGKNLSASGDSPIGLRALGKSVNKFRVYSFAMGGAVAGLAGGLYAWYNGGVVTMSMFPTLITFQIWMAMLVGGLGKNRAMLIGGFILAVLLYGFKLLPLGVVGGQQMISNLRFVLMGLAIIFILRLRPEGIAGEKKI